MSDHWIKVEKHRQSDAPSDAPLNSPFIVGLTGGIGSGKSTVATYFSKFPVAVIDSDVIAHQLTAAGGAAIPLIVAQFGAKMLDETGAMNRSAMRQLVFREAAARQQLEALIHPLIRQAMMRASEQARQEGHSAYQLWVIPLLVEHIDEWRALLNRILLIDCEPETQAARVQARSGLEPAQVAAMIAAQTTRVQRQAHADDCLNTDHLSLTQLSARVRQLHEYYIELAQVL